MMALAEPCFTAAKVPETLKAGYARVRRLIRLTAVIGVDAYSAVRRIS